MLTRGAFLALVQLYSATLGAGELSTTMQVSLVIPNELLPEKNKRLSCGISRRNADRS